MINPGANLGPYEIIASAGAGGMGEVYKARDKRLDRTVAIKVLPKAVESNPDLKMRFDREARAISSLNHPHICTLYDVGHENGMDYLVMEYIEGETLAARLQAGHQTQPQPAVPPQEPTRGKHTWDGRERSQCCLRSRTRHSEA